MSYRPITDTWILARSKTKYYGAFPAGFLHRARALMGVGPKEGILHVCAGKVREYPFRGLGPNDKTVDIDPDTKPDFVMDVRNDLPCPECFHSQRAFCPTQFWPGILIDRPYSEEDADHYAAGRASLPPLNDLLKRCLQLVEPGRCVGVLDYVWPHPGKLGKEVAVVGVGTGRNARARWFTVFERLSVVDQALAHFQKKESFE